ncbi:MAG: Na+/Pi symporter [Watsoniomyces obsoletus]|nr:MAG: Na+/Pi symporter [Watsoniomyces obsoletus]
MHIIPLLAVALGAAFVTGRPVPQPQGGQWTPATKGGSYQVLGVAARRGEQANAFGNGRDREPLPINENVDNWAKDRAKEIQGSVKAAQDTRRDFDNWATATEPKVKAWLEAAPGNFKNWAKATPGNIKAWAKATPGNIKTWAKAAPGRLDNWWADRREGAAYFRNNPGELVKDGLAIANSFPSVPLSARYFRKSLDRLTPGPNSKVLEKRDALPQGGSTMSPYYREEGMNQAFGNTMAGVNRKAAYYGKHPAPRRIAVGLTRAGARAVDNSQKWIDDTVFALGMKYFPPNNQLEKKKTPDDPLQVFGGQGLGGESLGGQSSGSRDPCWQGPAGKGPDGQDSCGHGPRGPGAFAGALRKRDALPQGGTWQEDDKKGWVQQTVEGWTANGRNTAARYRQNSGALLTDALTISARVPLAASTYGSTEMYGVGSFVGKKLDGFLKPILQNETPVRKSLQKRNALPQRSSGKVQGAPQGWEYYRQNPDAAVTDIVETTVRGGTFLGTYGTSEVLRTNQGSVGRQVGKAVVNTGRKGVDTARSIRFTTPEPSRPRYPNRLLGGN